MVAPDTRVASEPDPSADVATPAESRHAPDPAPGADAVATSPLRRLMSGPRFLRYLELFALWGLAFTQPVLDVFGKNPDEFVARRVGGVQLVLFALLIAVLVPTVLWGVVVLTDLVAPKAATVVHQVSIGAAIALIVDQVLVTGLGLAPALALGGASGAAVAVFLYRHDWFRTWMRYLSLGPIAFVMLFLFASGASPLLRSSSTGSDAGSAPVASTPSRVVFVLFDELPMRSLLDGKGGIDATAFPNFAALAAETRWFRNASTIAPNTMTAVPALLTGTYPEGDLVPTYDNYPNNLFTFLRGSHELNVQESAAQLCPSDVCTPFVSKSGGTAALVRDAAQLWTDRVLNRLSATDVEPGTATGGVGTTGSTALGAGAAVPPGGVTDGDSRTAAAATGLQKFADTVSSAGFHEPVRFDTFVDLLKAPSSRPRLDFAHFVLPHFPWEILPGGHYYNSPANNGVRGIAYVNWGTVYASEEAHLRHMLQLQYADAFLGRVVAALKESGAWEDSLVIVTADHGVAFKPTEPYRVLSKDNAADLLWPPLFIRGKDFPVGIDDRVASLLDVLPTIADVQGMQIPWAVAGTSLRGPAKSPPDTKRLVKLNPLNLLPPSDVPGYSSVDIQPNFEEAISAPMWAVGDDDLRMFRHDDPFGLIGRDPATIEAGPQAPFGVKFVFGSPTIELAADTRLLPAYFQLSVSPLVVRGEVAVILNGAIVSQVPIDGQRGVSGVLPETRFISGANSLTFALIEGTADRPVLRPIPFIV